MNIVDAVIAIGFADKLFGTDKAVKAAAKRAAARMKGTDRKLVMSIVNSPTPRETMWHLIETVAPSNPKTLSLGTAK